MRLSEQATAKGQLCFGALLGAQHLKGIYSTREQSGTPAASSASCVSVSS